MPLWLWLVAGYAHVEKKQKTRIELVQLATSWSRFSRVADAPGFPWIAEEQLEV
jgi:hypothetical protein